MPTIMIFNPRKHKIFFFNEFVDLRKGHSSLIKIVTEAMKVDLIQGDLFLFISKNRKSIKGIYFDGTGAVLLHKKLEAGQFMSFNNSKCAFEVNSDEFKIIFHGGHIPLSRTGKRISLKAA